LLRGGRPARYPGTDAGERRRPRESSGGEVGMESPSGLGANMTTVPYLPPRQTAAPVDALRRAPASVDKQHFRIVV
jgi:hypothetical protein